MLKLITIFKDSQGKKHQWVFKNLDPTVTIEKARHSLELMTNLSLFEKDGVNKFHSLVSAELVEDNEPPLKERPKYTSPPKVCQEEPTETVKESGQTNQSSKIINFPQTKRK